MAAPEKDTIPKEKNNIDLAKALIDWSKWLIGVNFSAATGCMLVLLNKEKIEFIGPKLMYAIIFFALTVFICVVFTYLLATQFKQSFQLRWYHHMLAGLQILFFITALLYFYQWVIKTEKIVEKSKEVKAVFKTDSTVLRP
jgi:ABC-type Fe3+-siderophore transport system permease subunit